MSNSRDPERSLNSNEVRGVDDILRKGSPEWKTYDDEAATHGNNGDGRNNVRSNLFQESVGKFNGETEARRNENGNGKNEVARRE